MEDTKDENENLFLYYVQFLILPPHPVEFSSQFIRAKSAGKAVNLAKNYVLETYKDSFAYDKLSVLQDGVNGVSITEHHTDQIKNFKLWGNGKLLKEFASPQGQDLVFEGADPKKAN